MGNVGQIPCTFLLHNRPFCLTRQPPGALLAIPLHAACLVAAREQDRELRIEKTNASELSSIRNLQLASTIAAGGTEVGRAREDVIAAGREIDKRMPSSHMAFGSRADEGQTFVRLTKTISSSKTLPKSMRRWLRPQTIKALGRGDPQVEAGLPFSRLLILG